MTVKSDSATPDNPSRRTPPSSLHASIPSSVTPHSHSWAPFDVIVAPEKPQMPRPLRGPFGVGDRLRWVAFAELQASRGFAWAAETFSDAPSALREAWIHLAAEELKHMNWLLDRMKALDVSPGSRLLRADLWDSFLICKTAREFTSYMASAEERGRAAGEFFAETLKTLDPETGRLFEKIAAEEVEHVRLATQFYPDLVIT